MPCAARARFWIDGWLACKACWGDTPRLRTLAAPAALRAALICAPILARFVAACALIDTPVANIRAIAWHTGRSIGKAGLDGRTAGLDWLRSTTLMNGFPPIAGDSDNIDERVCTNVELDCERRAGKGFGLIQSR